MKENELKEKFLKKHRKVSSGIFFSLTHPVWEYKDEKKKYYK